MSGYPYRFEGEIVWHDVGSDKYAYAVVFLPHEIAGSLPLKKYPRLRVVGEIGEQPFEAALNPVRGRWYLLLSKKLMSAIGVGVGDPVEVLFEIGDQNAVSIPDALLTALGENEKVKALWDAASAGKQRGLAHMIASAKTVPTIQKRIAVVFGILEGRLDQRGKPIEKAGK